MLNFKQWIAVPMAVALGMLGLSGSAKAQGWSHIDEVACQMHQDALVLNVTAQTHLQGCGYINQVKQCVALIDRLALHIHANVAGQKCPISLRNDIRQLAAIHHQTECLFQALGRAGRINPHVYQLIACQMEKLDDSIHHLEEDLAGLQRHPQPSPFLGNAGFPGQGFPSQGQYPSQRQFPGQGFPSQEQYPSQGQFPGQGFPQSVPSYPGLGQPSQPYPTQPGLNQPLPEQPLQQPSLFQRTSYQYPQQGLGQAAPGRGITIGNDRFQITFGGRR